MAPRRRIDRGLLIASLAIATGIVIAVWGVFGAVTGTDRFALPDGLERVDPVPDAIQVLPQTAVFVDLEQGYTGVLVVDGVELETINLDQIGAIDVEPGRQVDLPPVTVFEPGNATLTFTPSRGAVVERFGTGLHTVTVVFWRLDEGRDFARSYSWTFNVL